METASALPATGGCRYVPGQGYQLPEYAFVAPPDIASGQVHRHPIVIVGGGLTGLTLACALAQLGVPAVLLDEDNTVGVKGASSRGICYTQKSLEIFHRLGIYDRLAAKGVQWSVGRTFAGHDEVYSFDLRQQSSFGLSSQPPFINIQQFYIEACLVERIAALNGAQALVALRWNSRVTGFVQHEGFATLSVQTPAGGYTLQADHVVDASGAHTPFHAWCGAQLSRSGGDDRWCIADVRFSEHPPAERHTWIEAPFNEQRAVWQHLMADDVWRIDYQMAPGADPAEISREEVVRQRLQKQFGEQVDCEIVWVGPYTYRSQCVDRLRIGSVFFVGDTVKIVSPFGARGGNTGIADADNLAWKLAAVIQGRAPARLLDSYHEERLEAAQQNVLVTSRTARFLRPADGAERVFRAAAISLAKQHLFARALINTGRMAVANTYTRSSVCQAHPQGLGGTSVQNVMVGFDRQCKQQGTLGDLLTWCQGRLLLLVFGRIPAMDVPRLQALAQQFPLRVVQVLATTQAAVAREHVFDPQGHLRLAARAESSRWVLLRPDAYLAGAGPGGPKWRSQVTALLQQALAHSTKASP